ncbi:MAG: hypothetical protein OXH92_19115, partial [Bryobacterales bacterium]|nr:hypothetical protein [Bryobacterales bacterium]
MPTYLDLYCCYMGCQVLIGNRFTRGCLQRREKLIDAKQSDAASRDPGNERTRRSYRIGSGRRAALPVLCAERLACISHHPTVEARHTTARTSLR